MAGGDTEDCFICRKHRDRGSLVPGGPVAEDGLVLLSLMLARIYRATRDPLPANG